MADINFSDFWDEMYLQGKHLEFWEESSVSADFLSAVDCLGLQPDSSVLDIGCGSGLEACELAAIGYQVHGIDISPEAIRLAGERARSLNLSIGFRRGNALQLPYAAGSFDLLTDRGCLHLIPHGKWPQFAAETLRVLRPAGRLLLRGCSDVGNPDFHALSTDMVEVHFGSAGWQLLELSRTRLANRHGGLPGLQLLLGPASQPSPR